MSKAATGFPLPDLDYAPLAPLWNGAALGDFRLPRCKACRRFDWYPTGRCRACDSDEILWESLSGRATLFSWSVVHRALYKPLSTLGRYASAIVTIAEDPATRFVTRLVEARADRLRGGMPLVVRFADAGFPAVETGRIVPLFAPADPEDRGAA